MSRWFLFLLAATLASAQGGPGVVGNWMGTLNAGPMKLRVALKVAKAADGSLSATFASLDQGARDLPVSLVRQSGLNVALELKMLDASYDGTLKADGSEMAGEWNQRGAALPLTFRRVDKVEAAAARPQEPRKPYENKAGGSKLAGTLPQPPGKGPFPAVSRIVTKRCSGLAPSWCWRTI